jgi:uncharacterized protein
MKRQTLALAALLATVLASSAARAQDFDCRTAASGAETTICGSATLRKLDDQMADLYGQLWGLLGNPMFDDSYRIGVRGYQREFLASREECGADAKCLTKLYQRRNLGLIHTIQSVNRRVASNS